MRVFKEEFIEKMGKTLRDKTYAILPPQSTNTTTPIESRYNVLDDSNTCIQIQRKDNTNGA